MFISTRATRAAHSEVSPGPYVMIAVSDTGAGIPAAIREKVVRALLHHQGYRQRHRSRAEHGVRLREAVRRATSRSTAKRATARRSRSICRERAGRVPQPADGPIAAHRRRTREHSRRRGRCPGAQLRGGAAAQPGLQHVHGKGCDRGTRRHRWWGAPSTCCSPT